MTEVQARAAYDRQLQEFAARTGMPALPQCMQIPPPSECYPAGTTWDGYVPHLPSVGPTAPKASSAPEVMAQMQARAIDTSDSGGATVGGLALPWWAAFGAGALGGALLVSIFGR